MHGVLAARERARSDGRRHLEVGFNVADAEGARRFWSGLARIGGGRFAGAVDWVGLDRYPATWSGAPPSGDGLAELVRQHVAPHWRSTGVPGFRSRGPVAASSSGWWRAASRPARAAARRCRSRR